MAITEACDFLYSKLGGVKRTEVYWQTAAVRDAEEFNVEEDDWDLAYIPVELQTDVRASFRLDFNAIRFRCQEAALAVPKKANEDFGLALQGVDAIAERQKIMEEKRAAVAAGDSAVQEKKAACIEIVKIQEDLNSSAQKIGALEAQKGELTTDLDTTRSELTVMYVPAHGKEEVNAELVRERSLNAEIQRKYKTSKAKIASLEGRLTESWRERKRLHESLHTETSRSKVAECSLLSLRDRIIKYSASVGTTKWFPAGGVNRNLENYLSGVLERVRAETQ